MGKRIAVCGPIGAGKSYFLKSYSGCAVILEKFDKKILKTFYRCFGEKPFVMNVLTGLLSIFAFPSIKYFIADTLFQFFAFIAISIILFIIFDTIEKYRKERIQHICFRTQMMFVSERVKNAQGVNDGNVIFDRSPEEDFIFASMHKKNGNITESDFGIYKNFFDTALKLLPPIDHYIFIKTTPQICFDHVQSRIKEKKERGEDTEGEEGITMKYLEELHIEYAEWVNTKKHAIITIAKTDELKGVIESLLKK